MAHCVASGCPDLASRRGGAFPMYVPVFHSCVCMCVKSKRCLPITNDCSFFSFSFFCFFWKTIKAAHACTMMMIMMMMMCGSKGAQHLVQSFLACLSFAIDFQMHERRVTKNFKESLNPWMLFTLPLCRVCMEGL